MTVSIRVMQPEDLDSVTAIEQQVTFDTPWSRRIFEDCLMLGYSCWVLEQRSEVLGFGLLSVAAEEAHILNLCIKQGYQRVGLGSQMLAHLVELAKQQAVAQIYLEVSVDNQPAIQLYERAGFTQIGVRREYYSARDGKHDALVMSLKFSEGVATQIDKSLISE